MSDSRVHLLGTVHRDPGGAAKLHRALGARQPDVVTVEVSPYALSFRRQRGKALRAQLRRRVGRLARELERPPQELLQHPAVVLLLAALRLPFEQVAAARWARRRGARWLAIDDSERSQRYLAQLEHEALHPDNLRALLTGPEGDGLGERVIEQELLARQYLRSAGLFAYHFPSGERADIAARDRRMADRIRDLLCAEPAARLAHVCGWEHLVLCEGVATIAAQLADLGPTRELI